MKPTHLLRIYDRVIGSGGTVGTIRLVGITAVRDAVLEDAAERIETMAASPLGTGESERLLRGVAARLRQMKEER